MSNDNIVDLATTIQNVMKEHIKNFPNCKYEDVVKTGIMAGLRLGRGHYSPQMIQALVSIERSVFVGTEIMKKGYMPC